MAHQPPSFRMSDSNKLALCLGESAQMLQKTRRRSKKIRHVIFERVASTMAEQYTDALKDFIRESGWNMHTLEKERSAS